MVELVVDSEPFELLEIRSGQIRWESEQVPTQPGDGSAPRPHPLHFHGGFGASKRYTGGPRGATAPTHHDYSEHMDVRSEGLGCVAPKITYLSLAASGAPSFRLGGGAFGRLGGSPGGGLGGGTFKGVPQAMERFGDFVYVAGSNKVYVVDITASTPTLVETRDMGSTARPRSLDEFDNVLAVANGDVTDAQIATAPATSSSPTQWSIADGVKRSVYRTGKGGRLFSSYKNRVYNVLGGQDPATLSNYLPSLGEVLSDEGQPVQALLEFSRALVGATTRTVRTFDPDAGFFGRALLPVSRVSPSDYDGRAMIAFADFLIFALPHVVWMMRAGQRPIKAGPELLDQNESPYIGGQPGLPDTNGSEIFWPIFFPTSGDSVIFSVRLREQGERGVGPLVWQPFLWLENRECRVVHFWGGTSSVKPRLVFGAGTTSSPEQIGWVPLGRGGSPDVFDSDASPAISGTLYAADDDFGLPSTIKEVERIEFGEITNADESNYLVASVSVDGGTDYADLVTDQQGAPDSPRIRATGPQSVFAPIYDPQEGVKLKFRFAITQAAAASSFLTWRGFPIAYLSERPLTSEQVTTLLDVKDGQISTAEDLAAEVRDLVRGKKIEIEGGPGDRTRWAKVSSVNAITVEMSGRDQRVAVELVFREVAVS